MRRLVLLLGVAVLAAGIWFMVASMGGEPGPMGMVWEREVLAGESDAALSGGEAEREEPAATPETGLERSEVEATGANAGGSIQLIRVLVTNKLTGDPVPGAEVSYYEYFRVADLGTEEQAEYRQFSRDPEKLAARYGTTVLADGNGVATIPMKEYVRTVGRHGELYGQLNIRLDPEDENRRDYELELERDLTLVVQVLDSLGQAAVGVRVRVLPRWAEGQDGIRSPFTVGTSEAPRGLVMRPHWQISLRRWKRQEPYPVGHLLRPFIPGLTEGGEPFDGENPPADPIVLQLPPTGRVTVQALDASGKPFPMELASTVQLTFPPPENQSENALYRPPPNQRWTARAEKDLPAVFERVVAGKTYMTTTRVGRESPQEIFQGPLAEGQEVHVTLSLENDPYILVGRVVDERQEPTRDVRLRMRYGFDGAVSGAGTLQIGEDGQFRTVLSAVGRAGEITLSQFTLEDRPIGVGAGGPARMYAMVGDRSLVPGENNLGDLVLTPSPFVASGRILINGEIPEQARVRLSVQRHEITQSRTTTRERWRNEQLNVRFPEPGRFEILGVAQPARYRLRVSGTTYLPMDPVEFAVGADNLLVELDSGGSLRALVLMDEMPPVQMFLPVGFLGLRLVATDGHDTTQDEQRVVPSIFAELENRLYGQLAGEEDGGQIFRWNALWPGRYRLEVLPRGGREPLVVIPGIHITAGERNRDPRLDPIDLRGKLRRITVRVLDASGQPLDPGTGRTTVLINDRTAEAELQGFSAQNGRATILTGEPYLDLLVAARGYRPKELSGVSSDITVMLERFPEVVVRITDVLEDLPEDCALRVSITRKDRQRDIRRYSYEMGSGGLDSMLRPPMTLQELRGGEVALPVDGDGVYRVRVSLRNDETRRSVTVADIEPPEIEVRISMGRQVFEIRVPEEALKQAVNQAAVAR